MIRPLLVASAVAGVLVLGAGLTACTGANPITAPSTPRPTPTVDAGVQPVGTPTDVVTGLAAPWSIVQFSGLTLVSERDTGVIEQLTPSGGLNPVGTVPGVVHQGEGGLLGLAYLDDGGAEWLYAYESTADDNRIVRMELGGDLADGEPSLGDVEVVLSGLAQAGNHNGGRIAFGPDGMLYATVGDAGQPDRAQDPASLNGKILRMTPTGDVPSDNPTADSLVYSMGHRNPQGLAWDSDGQLWAAEFGQDTWDEFNRIEPGGNYGWPVVEGQTGDPRFIDPWVQWATDDASPSGLAYIDGTFFLAALKGQRVWAIYVDEAAGAASVSPYFVGELGRIRDVTEGPDGSLWLLTNNTDGRGSPRDGDDRIMQVELTPLVEG
ncbi:PQQ-dependent sugar dehydrogenase [soil metagenome]